MTQDKWKVLVVDDEPSNLQLLRQVLLDKYQLSFATNGPKALEIMKKIKPDLVLLDIMMPSMDGYETCREIKADPQTSSIPVIFITALGKTEDERRGFDVGGVDYITKPISPPIVLARVNTHLTLYRHQQILERTVQERTQQLQEAFETIKYNSLDTIHRLSKAAEYKDENTADHLFRMSNYSCAIARAMGVNPDTVESILYASPMHDIGKIGIPDSILLKPGQLTSEEWEIMKQHPVIGGKILEGSDKKIIRLGEIIALTHHEKWDGTGYPKGLKGDEIPKTGRIVAIADVFDALTSRRPYKEAFSNKKAFEIINQSRGTHFDPQVVDAFFSIKDEILIIQGAKDDTPANHFLVNH